MNLNQMNMKNMTKKTTNKKMKKVKMNMMTMTMKKMVNKDPLLKSSLKVLVLMLLMTHSVGILATRISNPECSVSKDTLETNVQAYHTQSIYHPQETLHYNQYDRFQPQQKTQTDSVSQTVHCQYYPCFWMNGLVELSIVRHQMWNCSYIVLLAQQI